MFHSTIYKERRKKLKEMVHNGIILLPGNNESPMNYEANPYPFRQDSTFLYYFGIDSPSFFGVIDCDNDSDILFGYDFTIDDIVWMGPQTTLEEHAAASGCDKFYDIGNLQSFLENRLPKTDVHILPQYRAENIILLSRLLKKEPQWIQENYSVQLIKAVASQREIKSEEEIQEIENALDISYMTHTIAMSLTREGLLEREIVAEMEKIVKANGSMPSFPTIFSIHGEILHNHHHNNMLRNGKLVVNDSGVESSEHYASDITRTFPVSGTFSPEQREIYQIVLEAQKAAIQAMKPGEFYKDIHLLAARVIAEGLHSLGLIKGNVEDAVHEGAHALFFPHGLGHLLGLDVHDLENLGEDYFGYDDSVQRSDQFGLAYLRFAKKLKPGHVLTVEPGIYFIPQLIKLWKKENKLADFINYEKVEKYLEFGGIRIEDDVLVTETGSRILGTKIIPKEIDDVEQACAS